MTDKRYFGRALAAAAVCVMLTACGAGNAFAGSRLTDENGFRLEYTILNQEESASLELWAGDRLKAEISQQSGTVDLLIGMEGAEPAYEGNGLTELDFTLNIAETGQYRISVTGHKAVGSVILTVLSGENREEDRTSDSTETGENAADGTSVVNQGAEEAEIPAPNQGADGAAERENGIREDDMSAPASEAVTDGRDEAAYAAYQFALQQIAFEHIYPDGTDTGFDGVSGFIEDNHFALYDVNGDGAEELIVQFVTAPMAGNVEKVYAYDEEDGSLQELLCVFPAMNYYTGGLVREDWSHGSELAGDGYWPYNLYRYDAETGRYELTAEVNMWSSSADTVDYKGDPYPEDIDVEGAGTVFIVTRNGTTETMSKSAYETWLSGMMGDAVKSDIPYQALSEENIRAVIPDPS